MYLTSRPLMHIGRDGLHGLCFYNTQLFWIPVLWSVVRFGMMPRTLCKVLHFQITNRSQSLVVLELFSADTCNFLHLHVSATYYMYACASWLSIKLWRTGYINHGKWNFLEPLKSHEKSEKKENKAFPFPSEISVRPYIIKRSTINHPGGGAVEIEKKIKFGRPSEKIPIGGSRRKKIRPWKFPPGLPPDD